MKSHSSESVLAIAFQMLHVIVVYMRNSHREKPTVKPINSFQSGSDAVLQDCLQFPTPILKLISDEYF